VLPHAVLMKTSIVNNLKTNILDAFPLIESAMLVHESIPDTIDSLVKAILDNEVYYASKKKVKEFKGRVIGYQEPFLEKMTKEELFSWLVCNFLKC